MKHYVLFVATMITAGCGQAPVLPPPAVTVSTAVAISCEVPRYYDYIGHVIPLNTINIVPQVQGYLTKIYFQEGQEVKAGDLLATIDDRPYKAALAKAEATLAQTIVALKYSEDTVQRYAKLVPEDFVSQLDFDNYVTNVLSNEAVIKQNLADIETAKLNLNYCFMMANVDGVVGVRLIDEGNFIPPATTDPIVILNQLQPITAEFYAPEDDLTEIRKAHARKSLVARIFLEGEKNQGHDGNLTLINNQVDQPTGSILLRATLPNEDHALWPGQFVSVRLFLEQIPGAILVPAQAVQIGQEGAYVFVVNNGTADLRLVKKGQLQGDLVVIEKGLAAGETVVVEGQVNLFPGAKVSANNAGAVMPTFNPGLHP
jgi:membrane fusion protein, multidrug efflux system